MAYNLPPINTKIVHVPQKCVGFISRDTNQQYSGVCTTSLDTCSGIVVTNKAYSFLCHADVLTDILHDKSGLPAWIRYIQKQSEANTLISIHFDDRGANDRIANSIKEYCHNNPYITLDPLLIISNSSTDVIDSLYVTRDGFYARDVYLEEHMQDHAHPFEQIDFSIDYDLYALRSGIIENIEARGMMSFQRPILSFGNGKEYTYEEIVQR